MLSLTAQRIIAEIDAHMTAWGGSASDWYVGIASKPRERLFTDHKVRNGDGWIYREASNHTEAREIEAIYHNCGHQGGPGGGDWSTRFVYAYLIRQHTVE